MGKIQIKMSPSFKDDVLKKAAKMAKEGKTEGPLEIEAFGPLHVYIDHKPGEILHVFDGDETEDLKGKKIYVSGPSA